MTIFLTIVHVIVCIVLILVVLLQAGRGGGVSDMMGGGQPQTLFGTQTNAFMTRATEVCAVIFILTSLTLGVLSTQRGKSLIAKRHIPATVTMPVTSVPAAPVSAVTPPAPPASTAASPAPAAQGDAR